MSGNLIEDKKPHSGKAQGNVFQAEGRPRTQVPRRGTNRGNHKLRHLLLGEVGEWARVRVKRSRENHFGGIGVNSKWPSVQLSNISPSPFHCRLWCFKDQLHCSADSLYILHGTDHVYYILLTVGS